MSITAQVQASHDGDPFAIAVHQVRKAGKAIQRTCGAPRCTALPPVQLSRYRWRTVRPGARHLLADLAQHDLGRMPRLRL
jgi:hypothetical protein